MLRMLNTLIFAVMIVAGTLVNKIKQYKGRAQTPQSYPKIEDYKYPLEVNKTRAHTELNPKPS